LSHRSGPRIVNIASSRQAPAPADSVRLNKPGGIFSNRWIQLSFGVLCTVMLSNMQYGWTLFVNPMHDAMHWPNASIQVAFTIMIMVNTWLSPFEGWLVDRYGPRPVVMFGGAMAGLSWVLNARVQSLPGLYAAAVVGGVGVGCVFGTCMGTALKWFPDRRGLAAGMIAAGFGLGAAITVIPVAASILKSGYRDTFSLFGLIQGVTIFVTGALLVKPRPLLAIAGLRAPRSQGAELAPTKVILTGTFWMIYVIYLMIAFGGMVVTAQLGPIARDFHVEKSFLAFAGFSLPVLTLTLSLDNFANGITRPLCGFLSDRIGRENTMLLVFSLEAVALTGMAVFGRHPVAFVIFAAWTFLCWGEVFSIFPAICGDTFGIKNAAANNGMLYTAKGVSSAAVPLAGLIAVATGGWTTVLLVAASASLLAGVLAKVTLAPMRTRLMEIPKIHEAGQ
jgi:OFA family oxalate/formate antiporter-like MFS transporter